jgi:hypothetical protein
MKWISLLIIFVTLVYFGYKDDAADTYPHIEVIDYDTMIKKAEYGSINNNELRIGAFDLINNSLCIKVTDDLTTECRDKFKSKKENCAQLKLDTVDATKLNGNQAYLTVRQFNVCRK